MSSIGNVGRLLLVALLAACGDEATRIDLEAMEEVASFKTSSSPTGAAFDVEELDGVVWVRDSYGLQMYRLHSGEDAEHLGALRVEPQSPQAGNHLAVKKGLVAVGHGARVVLFAYDSGDAPNPRQIAAFSSGGTGVGQLTFDGNWLYYAGLEAGVRRVDVSTPSEPGAPEIISPAYAKSIHLEGGRLYAGGSDGLTIVSLDTGLQRLGTVKVPMMSDLALYDGRWLYGSVGDVGDTAIIDVKDPAAPRVAKAGFGSGTNSAGMLLNGDQLIVPSGSTGQLKDYDLGNPEAPDVHRLVTPIERYSRFVTHDLALAGDYLLLAHDQGFFVFRRHD
ncbi:hypothetical protein [Myxococcus sp. RHSTA-1-4]|uniref:hypothetical protein n=1 Tax=Myxococcus sp. RHSTA-1-4 TaxID=2874601 RepID=UPI001CC13BE7|nr:hypothetical protein [Myxococcus sp. RHSTA-1-4]MBZ4419690.1 hypothetical protein [Myxococcus sp. RHSTA-1-4]